MGSPIRRRIPGILRIRPGRYRHAPPGPARGAGDDGAPWPGKAGDAGAAGTTGAPDPASDGHEDGGRPTLTLAPTDRLAPRRLLIRPDRFTSIEVRSGVLAPLIHRELIRYARLDAAIDRALGRTLRKLRRIDGLPRLGHARLGDYTRERLGLGARWAQELMRLADALEDLPALAAAHAAGRITTSKVLTLLPVVTSDTETEWLNRSSRATVRRLRNAVRAELAARRMPSHAAHDGDDSGSTDGSGEDSGATAPEAPFDEQEDGVWIQMPAPAAVAYLYDHTIAVARRLAGGQVPVFRCIEHVLAEYTAAVGLSSRSAGRAPESTGSDTDGKPGGGIAGANESGRTIAARRIARDRREAELEAHTADWRSLEDPDVAIALTARLAGEHDPSEAVALDRRLRRLIRVRQMRHGEMARLLRSVHELRLWHALHFASFDHYCREALGISTRLAQELVRADRAFDALPRISNAYRRGALSWTKTRLLISICRRDTQAAWIERAKEVTVRYLELAVARSHRDRERDPAGWALDGGPPPLQHVSPHGCDSRIRPGAGLWEDRSGLSENGGKTASAPRAPTAVDAGSEAHMSAHGHVTTRLPCRIRLWLPERIEPLWSRVDAQIAAAAGRPTAPWERLFALLLHFLETWDREEVEKLATEYRVLNRDGWCCTAPGCTARRNLQVHHVVLRAQQGSHDLANRTTVCACHHLIGIHGDGRLGLSGTAPDDLVWRSAVDAFRGDVRIARTTALITRRRSGTPRPRRRSRARSRTRVPAGSPAPGSGRSPGRRSWR